MHSRHSSERTAKKNLAGNNIRCYESNTAMKASLAARLPRTGVAQAPPRTRDYGSRAPRASDWAADTPPH